jgi:hypothetical protein
MANELICKEKNEGILEVATPLPAGGAEKLRRFRHLYPKPRRSGLKQPHGAFALQSVLHRTEQVVNPLES